MCTVKTSFSTIKKVYCAEMKNRIFRDFFEVMSLLKGGGGRAQWRPLLDELDTLSEAGNTPEFVHLLLFQCLKKIDSSPAINIVIFMMQHWVLCFSAFQTKYLTENAKSHVRPRHETTPSGNKTEKRFIDAVHDALDQAMTKHNNLVLMGQDIADYGGVFKATEGFTDKYGKDRVRNTPLCESAILGAGLGLTINGYKAMVEMQFADFVSEGITQICNNLAKIHWRWGQNADVVVRMPTGAGVAAGPYHSQSTEAWFAHTPGLKVAYPAFPADAKGLLLRAFEDPNPVLFFEHKALYRSVSEEVAEGYYSLPFGKANVLTTGSELTIVTYGLGVHWALEEAKNHPEGVVEVIDLRTLVPLDEETIYASVNKTGKVLVLHEDVARGGFGGELVALINEHCFEQLDAPVKRLGSLNTAVPFAPELEQGFLAKSKLSETVNSLLDY